MPWSSITSTFSDGGGIWAFAGAVFTTICFAALGFVKLIVTGKTSRDADLAARENSLVQHMADELSRLNALVTNLDVALKGQVEFHRIDMQRERDECNARMTGLQGEIEILKQRMSHEEHR